MPHLLEAKGIHEAKQEEVLTARRFSDEAAAAALLAIATSVFVKACERERKQAAAAV
jgi:hypothetical protein